MNHFQNVLRTLRYLSNKQSYQLFFRRRESFLLPHSFLLSPYIGRRFRNDENSWSSRSGYKSPNDNFGALPFMAFGIVVARCAVKDEENKLSSVYGM
jgi:hypothetical protein